MRCVKAPAALAFAILASAQAQNLPDNTDRQVRALLAEKASRNPAQAKMDSHLVHAAQILRGQPMSPDLPSLAGELEAVRPDSRNLVEVDIRTDVNPDLLTLIGTLGGTLVNAFPQYESVRARLPLLSVERVAQRSEVRQIRVAERFHVNATPAVSGPDSTGDIAHQANLARSNFNFDGTGVKVGLISDGVDSLASEQAKGNLPAAVNVIGGQAGSGDEGTALMEVVYTLAPGATLYFATADGGQTQMASNIQALTSAGCNIIMDDVSYFSEGAFQDDIVARQVNAATNAGVFYFTAAGNSGSLKKGTSGTWQGDFADSGTTFSDNSVTVAVHSFGATNYDRLTAASAVTVIGPSGGSAGAYELMWSDPLGKSSNDYDLFITDSSGNVLASSTNVQNGTQDPEENVTGSAAVSSACGSGTCRILVVKHTSAAARALYLSTERGTLSIATNSATYGHAAAANVFGIAATDVRYTSVIPGCSGVFSATCNNGVDTYSSDGPRQMFYNADGSAITPNNFLIGTDGGTVLSKPDATAADVVTTGVPGYTLFGGTSAAAPHAAAIAALLLQAVPTMTPAMMHAGFAANTINAIAIEGAAPNINAGDGILMAPGSVESACGYNLGTLSPVPGSGANISLSIQANAACPWTITGLPSWVSGATSGKGGAAVTLTVAANSGGPRSATVSLAAGVFGLASTSVNQASGVPPVVITTSATLLSGFTGGAYSQDLTATGGVGAYTWTLTAGTLPPGLTLAGAVITGTPTTATGSPFSFTLQAADAVGDIASQAFRLTVVNASGTSLSRVGVLSQFAAGGGYTTAVWVVNTSAAAVPVRLMFHGDDGTLVLPTPTPLTVTQQGDAQVITATTLDRVLNANTGLVITGGSGQAVNVQGWVDVLATATVSGFAVFTYAPGGLTPGVAGFVTPWEGTVPLQTQLTPTTMVLPFDNTNGFNNGVAIGTLSNSAATITATFYDINGNALGTPQAIPLAANGHTSFMLYLQYPFTANKQGSVVFTGTTVMGLGLRASPYGTLTSVPTILQ